ncbi:MAG: hypoxanthine phosphoribosyltransferase [Acidobacteria bacterium]|nr:hypoxanthine phosphoribosyltransferase [Acidobacteriota bacterium]
MKTAFSEEQIQVRVRALAQEISRDYAGEIIHAIGILDSAFLFFADLVRRISLPVHCHFVKMDAADRSEAGILIKQIAYSSPGKIAGQNVLLVDTVVASGITLDHLVQQLQMEHPRSVKTAVLINREDHRRVPLRIDYVGFAWKGESLVGYGLEHESLYRNLPYLATLPAR